LADEMGRVKRPQTRGVEANGFVEVGGKGVFVVLSDAIGREDANEHHTYESTYETAWPSAWHDDTTDGGRIVLGEATSCFAASIARRARSSGGFGFHKNSS
jgi:hypothetical protein